MAEKVPMIALSPTMESGKIVKWHKKKGDTVKAGDIICEVETDKAIIDYESTQEGTLLEIIVDEGQEVEIGEPNYLKLSVWMEGLLESREELNSTLDQKVSLNAFFIKLAAETLKRHPMVNAGWDDGKIKKFGRINIGLAVAVPDGLVAPVVKDCANKGTIQIDRELRQLVEKARQNKLNPEDMQDATFTISNLGSYGIEEFTAIINPPGSAILALGEKKNVPVSDEDEEIWVESRMKMTLCCDHRVIDGAGGAEFLNDLKDAIEDPITVLF